MKESNTVRIVGIVLGVERRGRSTPAIVNWSGLRIVILESGPQIQLRRVRRRGTATRDERRRTTPAEALTRTGGRRDRKISFHRVGRHSTRLTAERRSNR